MSVRKKGNQLESDRIAPVVIERIRARMPDFTPQQKILAEYMAQHLETVCFYSVGELAASAGVSSATVVRFCHKLGYNGYAHLAREIRQKIQAELNTLGRFNLSMDMKPAMAGSPKTGFERVLRQEMKNLANLAKNIHKRDFDKAIDWLAASSYVVVSGAMGSTPLADYLAYMAKKILPRVVVKHDKSELGGNDLSKITKDTVFVFIAFPRYPRATIELIKLANRFEAKIIVITDSHASPLTPYADLVFLIPIGIPSFVDAYAAPLAFLHALVSELGEKHPETTTRYLGMFEEYAKQLDLFYYRKETEIPIK
jgi:DNA-binding MurR/RpiR family transcriptional regulator